MISVRRRPRRQTLRCKAVSTRRQTKSNHTNITTRHAVISGKKRGGFLPEKRSLSLQLEPEHGTPAQRYLKSLSRLFPGDSVNLLAISRSPELQWAGAGDTTQPVLKTSLLDLTDTLRKTEAHLLNSFSGSSPLRLKERCLIVLVYNSITNHKVSCQHLQLYLKGTIITTGNFIVIWLTTNNFWSVTSLLKYTVL